MKYDQSSASFSLKVLELIGEWKAENCSRSCSQEGRHTNSRKHWNCKKKTDAITTQLHEVEQQERQQLQEQDIAQRLISEAASKLSTAVKSSDMQTAKVAQVMLDSGNDKLNETMKQLVNVRASKEKLQAKLLKARSTLREMTMKHSNTDEEPAGPSAKRPKKTSNPVYCQGTWAKYLNSVLICPRDWRPCPCEPDLSVWTTKYKEVYFKLQIFVLFCNICYSQ